MATDDRMAQSIATIMTRDVQTVTPTTSLEHAVRELLEHHISGMPVVDRGRVVGVVTLTDMAKRFRGEAPEGTMFYSKEQLADLLDTLVDGAPLEGVVREVMSTSVISIGPEATIREAARLMVAERIHRILVVDPAGGLVGIVSTLDIVDDLSK